MAAGVFSAWSFLQKGGKFFSLLGRGRFYFVEKIGSRRLVQKIKKVRFPVGGKTYLHFYSGKSLVFVVGTLFYSFINGYWGGYWQEKNE